jgi:hypothetical protein
MHDSYVVGLQNIVDRNGADDDEGCEIISKDRVTSRIAAERTIFVVSFRSRQH